MDRKKIETPEGQVLAGCGATAVEREVLAGNAFGELSFCAGCERFTLDAGAVRLTLSANRLIELIRLISSELERANAGARLSVRLSSEIALCLEHPGLAALDELLSAASQRAALLATQQSSRSSSSETVH